VIFQLALEHGLAGAQLVQVAAHAAELPVDFALRLARRVLDGLRLQHFRLEACKQSLLDAVPPLAQRVSARAAVVVSRAAIARRDVAAAAGEDSQPSAAL
jgi:hypothetical protein